jgi:hypothetical protein
LPDAVVIDSSTIDATLEHLANRYSDSVREPADQHLYAKLAVIEACGWIESCMAELILELSDRNLKQPKNRRTVADEVKRTYSFSYNEHFRPMLISVVGIIMVEKLEAALDESRFQDLKSELGSLKTARDQAAHSFMGPNPSRLDEPKRVQIQLSRVRAGLADIESRLRAWGY